MLTHRNEPLLHPTKSSAEHKPDLGTYSYLDAGGRVLGALKERNSGVLVLPNNSSNPTDLAGYPSIIVPFGIGPAGTSTEDAIHRSIDRGPNVL